MKNIIRFLLGLNCASIIRGLRLGPREFISGGFVSQIATYPLQDRAAYQTQKIFESIPTIALGEILGIRKAPVKLTLKKYEDGMLPNHEIMTLLAILVAENPKEVLEIGTFMGYSTRAMAENLPDSTIHTVDLPLDFSGNENAEGEIPKDDFHLIRRRVVGREFKDQVVAARIRQHFGDTAQIDFREFGQPTFFFIDGSHTYEYCKQDSEKCFAACNRKGVFLWHDCDALHPGVVRFISEWRTAGRSISRIEETHIAYWKSHE